MIFTRRIQAFFWYFVLQGLNGHVALSQTGELRTVTATEGRSPETLEGQMLLDAFVPGGSFLSVALPFSSAQEGDRLRLLSILKNQEFLDTLLSRLILPLVKNEAAADTGAAQGAVQNVDVLRQGLLHKDLLLEALFEKALSPGRFLREKKAEDGPPSTTKNSQSGVTGFLERREDMQGSASQDVSTARVAIQEFMRLFHKATGGSFDLAAAGSAIKDLPPQFCLQLGSLALEAGNSVLEAIRNADHPTSTLIQQIIAPTAGDGVPYVDVKKIRTIFGVKPDAEKYSQFNKAPADKLADILLWVLTEPKPLRSGISARDSLEARSRIVGLAAATGKLYRTRDLYANLAGSFADEFLIPAGITTEVANLMDESRRSAVVTEDLSTDVASDTIIQLATALGEIVNSTAFHAAIADGFVSLFLKPLGVAVPVAALLLAKKAALLKAFTIKALLLQEAVFNNDKVALALLVPKALAALKLRNGLSRAESPQLPNGDGLDNNEARTKGGALKKVPSKHLTQPGPGGVESAMRRNYLAEELDILTSSQDDLVSGSSSRAQLDGSEGSEDFLKSGAEPNTRATIPLPVNVPAGQNDMRLREATAKLIADGLTPDEDSELNVLFHSVAGGEMFEDGTDDTILKKKLAAKLEIQEVVREMGALYGESETQIELAATFVDHILIPSGTVSDVASMIRKARSEISVDEYDKPIDTEAWGYGAPGLASFHPIAMELERLAGGKIDAARMAEAFFKLVLIPLKLAIPVGSLLSVNKPRLLTAFALAALVALAPGREGLKRLLLLAVLAPAALKLLHPGDSGGKLSLLKLLIPLLGGLKLLALGSRAGDVLSPLAVLLPLLGGAALLSSAGQGGGSHSLGNLLLPALALGLLKSGGGAGLLALGSSLIPLLGGKLAVGELGTKSLFSLLGALEAGAVGELGLNPLYSLLGAIKSGGTGGMMMPPTMDKTWDYTGGMMMPPIMDKTWDYGGGMTMPPIMDKTWNYKYASEEEPESPAQSVADALTPDEESQINVLFHSVAGGEMFEDAADDSSLKEKLTAKAEIEAVVQEIGTLYGESEKQMELAAAFVDHILIPSGTVSDVAAMIRKARSEMSVDAFEKPIDTEALGYGTSGLASFLPIAMELEGLAGGKIEAALMAEAFFKLVLIPLKLAIPVASLLSVNKPRLLTAFALAALVALAPGREELKRLLLLAVLAPAALKLLHPGDSGGMLSPLKVLIPLLGGLKLLFFGSRAGDVLSPLAVLLPLLGGAALLSGGHGGGTLSLGSLLLPVLGYKLLTLAHGGGLAGLSQVLVPFVDSPGGVGGSFPWSTLRALAPLGELLMALLGAVGGGDDLGPRFSEVLRALLHSVDGGEDLAAPLGELIMPLLQTIFGDEDSGNIFQGALSAFGEVLMPLLGTGGSSEDFGGRIILLLQTFLSGNVQSMLDPAL